MQTRSLLALLGAGACIGAVALFPSEPGAASDPREIHPPGQHQLHQSGGVDTSSVAALETQEAALAKKHTQWLDRWAKRKKESTAGDGADALFNDGTRAEGKQNFKDAANAFTAFCAHYPNHPRVAAAAERAMFNHFRLHEYKEGLSVVEDSIDLVKGTPDVLRLHRLLGNTYLALPHWGLTRGGVYLREQSGQGKSTQSFWADRKKAIAHLEEARKQALLPDVISTLPTGTTSRKPLREAERNGVLFDLVAAVARFTPFDNNWGYWYFAWGQKADDGLENEGDGTGRGGSIGRRFGFGYGSEGYWGSTLNRARPKGLPVTPEGEILFERKPDVYAKSLPPTSKIKYLLDEIRQRDHSKKRETYGRSLLLQSALFRTRDGVERLTRLGSWWHDGGYPYKESVAKFSSSAVRLSQLKDDEVIGLIATHIGRYEVPKDESVPALLARVIKEAPKSKAADEGAYLLGAFHQSRRHYKKAIATFEQYEKSHPRGEHLSEAQSAIQEIRMKEALFTQLGVQPAGRKVHLHLKHRNLAGVDITATKMDMERILGDFKKAWRDGKSDDGNDDPVAVSSLSYRLTQNYLRGENHQTDFERYKTKWQKTFRAQLTPNAEYQYDEASVATPLSKPGLYVLRAQVPRKKSSPQHALSRGVLLVTGLAVVQKRAAKQWLVWVTDPITGKPVFGADVEAFKYWSTYGDKRSVRHSNSQHYKTDRQGLAKIPFSNRSVLTIVRHHGEVSFGDWGFWGSNFTPSSTDENIVSALTTDRPVYRPGDTVQLKTWVRKKHRGVYRPAADTKRISFRIYDAKGAQVADKTFDAGQWGQAVFSLPLDEDAPLGRYRVEVRADGNYTDGGQMGFSVEEYKAPEFTVSVKSAGEARLGEKIPVEIHADYLFGGGVAGGKVRYKVFRQDHKSQWQAPGTWDWLYGVGYGRCFYRYSWFGWWDAYGPWSDVWYPWWGPKPQPAKELVKEGEAKLGPDGVLKFDLDTSAAKANYGDTDHRYTIKAEVTDLSRRVIKGEGSMTVTRHAFQLGIEAMRGYSAVGNAVQLWLTAHRADGKGLTLKGRLVVEEVLYQGPAGQTVVEKEREVMPVETQAQGPVIVSWKAKHAGQYKFSLEATDSQGNVVRTSTVSWVTGPGWNGNTYRMNGLELITDQRTYAPGDVAKVLINVAQAGASVLLGTHVENGILLDYRMLKMHGKSQVVEIPITERQAPNFFIEATTVGDGELHQELRQLYVPPQQSAMHIEVKPSKEEYAPGEKASVVVTTTDGDGNPIQADVALSVFDSAVLYIQADTSPDIRARFWARLRNHTLSSSSNLSQRFDSYNSLANPDQRAASRFYAVTANFFQQAVSFSSGHLAVHGSGLAGDVVERPKDAPANAADSKRLAPTLSRRARSQSNKKVSGKLKAASSGLLGSRGSGQGGGGAGVRLDMDKSASFGKAGAAERDEEAKEAPAQKAAAGAKKVPSAASQKKSSVSVRRNFADTAFFSGKVRTDETGKATLHFVMPDNLTTWQIKAVGLGPHTRAGQSTSTMRTSKKLLVRLQAPRFFRERDEVVLSAIVHNKHKSARTVEVSLDVGPLLTLLKGEQTVRIKVAANTDKRVDWRMKVSGEGEAVVKMTVVTDDGEGDAKEMRFPVLVHGMLKTISSVGSIPSDHQGRDSQELHFTVPGARRPEQTKLTIRVSPTLAGAMLDALPYLLEYPYGCTEQTLSRFVPAVLTRKALQDAGGLKLEDFKKPHTNLNAQQLTTGGNVDTARLDKQYQRLLRSPVFNTKRMDRMIHSGLKRLTQMQRPDSGWGWWGADRSSRYTTAHVVSGLLDAQQADLAFNQGMLQRGSYALERLVEQSLYRYDDYDWVGNADAYAAWVLSRSEKQNTKLNQYLWKRRIKLSTYGKLLAALTFHNLGDYKKAATLLRNAEQIRQDDDENQTSWLETRKSGWWYWYNSDIETNAMWLRALNTIRDPKKRAPRVVKWLLNHREHGWYWRSTRDTAMVVSALANYMKVSKERRTDYDLQVLLDGEPVKKIHIDKKNLLTFDGEIVIKGKALSGGQHTLTFVRQGQGAVYFNTYLEVFTLEEDVKATGLEIKVERNYFKLQRHDREIIRYGARGQKIITKELAYQKIRLQNGADVKSGDLLLVELMLDSKNDYTFLAFEDPKPAGMEAVALKSGTTYGEAVANMELRDEKVVFFLRTLTRGKLKLSYRLRAEIPGAFHAMPTRGFAMYAPELKANSDEIRLSVHD